MTQNANSVKAKEIIQDLPFKTSTHWCTHFMRRNNLTLCQKTKIFQKLPADLEDKIKVISVLGHQEKTFPFGVIVHVHEKG